MEILFFPKYTLIWALNNNKEEGQPPFPHFGLSPVGGAQFLSSPLSARKVATSEDFGTRMAPNLWGPNFMGKRTPILRQMDIELLAML